MSRSQPVRPSRVAIAACTAAAAVLLAGCGAGQITDTATQRSAEGAAATASAGGIVVRDAGIEFGDAVPAAVVHPAGTTAPLQMHIVNTGATADKLVGAASPWASSVSITGSRDVPGGQTIVVGSTVVGSTVVTLPGTRVAQISLVGLLGDVRAGLTYPVVLEFEKAGPITIEVPVDNPDVPREPAQKHEE